MSATEAEAVRLAAVEDWLAEASVAYRGARVRLDPWQAIGLMQRLRGRGVQVHDDRAIALALAASKLIERPPSTGTAEVHWDAVPMRTPGGVGVSGTFAYGDQF